MNIETLVKLQQSFLFCAQKKLVPNKIINPKKKPLKPKNNIPKTCREKMIKDKCLCIGVSEQYQLLYKMGLLSEVCHRYPNCDTLHLKRISAKGIKLILKK